MLVVSMNPSLLICLNLFKNSLMRVLLSLMLSLIVMQSAFAFQKSIVNHDVLMAEKPARLLSQYGLFEELGTQVPSANVIPYDLITPLFTDYAEKFRFVFVPEGTSAKFQPDEVFDFPVGSVLVKTFSMPSDLREPTKNQRLIETRLLIHKANGWVALAYVWNEQQSDAVLKIAGKRLRLPVITRSGQEITLNYKVPNINQCKGCHAVDNKVIPIGPKVQNLNFTLEGQSLNQLAHWEELKLLEQLAHTKNLPKVVDWQDENADINLRARSYLDVNCAHCHRRDGPASNSGLFLTYNETNKSSWGYKKRPVAAGSGSGGLSYDIDPGKPELSILIYRLNSVDPAVLMPELGRSLVHVEAVKLLSEWISQMR